MFLSFNLSFIFLKNLSALCTESAHPAFISRWWEEALRGRGREVVVHIDGGVLLSVALERHACELGICTKCSSLFVSWENRFLGVI